MIFDVVCVLNLARPEHVQNFTNPVFNSVVGKETEHPGDLVALHPLASFVIHFRDDTHFAARDEPLKDWHE